LIIILVVLALSGLQQVRNNDHLTTIFLLDASDSIGALTQETGLSYVRQALAAMRPGDKGGLVLFGADALVERGVSADPQLGPPASAPNRNYTNIAGAIELGLSLFPNDTARRLVILSDGVANLGDARQAAQLARAGGVEVSVVPLSPQTGVEARLSDLSAPATLRQGEHFDLNVKIHGSVAMAVPLQIFSEGRLVAQQELTLQAGDNSFILPLVAGEPGFTTFRARIAPPADTFAQNNTLDAFSEVKGPLSILLVADQPAEGQPLAEALAAVGLAVRSIGPADFPADLGSLSEAATVVLVNVPAFKLTPRQLDLIQSYVRDLGHGLVVVGGDESYGPGGYFQTPLEETLPVAMTIQDQQRLPGMTLLPIIDKSGSMADGGSPAAFGPRKVELAKEAIYRSLDLLVPWDRIGVVAFDNAAQWVVEPVPAANIRAIKDAVGTIRASGGTDILAGLQLGAEAMVKETTQVRHIVLLTDGGADPTGILELTQELAGQGVTVSVVAIGYGYAPFLEEVARLGGGRFHFADDASVIPQIFAQETSLATRSYLVEETFTPQVAGPSPILQGFRELPALRGYVATSPKLTAQVVLRGGVEQDPLLAQWQYGLGRAVAWTSDAKGQWAGDWLSWPDFPRFWSQVVRWTIVEGTGGALESQVHLAEGRAIVTAEVLQPDGSYHNNLDVTLSLLDPELAQRTIPLRQSAPGLYEGSFRPEQTGVYLLHVTGQQAGSAVAAQTRGFVMSYSPEYLDPQGEAPLLPDLAEIGHGRVLPLESPAAAFAHTLPPARSATDLWPWLLMAALLLLPVDVGLRRIILGREDARQLLAKLIGWLPKQPARPQQPVSNAGRLFKVKERRAGASSETRLSTASPARPKRVSATRPEPEAAQAQAAALSERTAAAQAGQVEAVESKPEESTVQRLMRVKQKRRGDQ
jgi:uncharacterized membrane protein